MIRNVESFAKGNELVEMAPLLVNGALVARDPPAFESVPGLEDFERDAIRKEVLHEWRQPRALFYTIILFSIGAAVQ